MGYCLGDKVLNTFDLPTWSNGSNEQTVNTFSIVTFGDKGQDIHYTAYYSLILVLPALILALKNKNHLFAIVGKWLSIIFIVLLLISPLSAMI